MKAWSVEATRAPETKAPPAGGDFFAYSPEQKKAHCKLLKEHRNANIELRKELEKDLAQQNAKTEAEKKQNLQKQKDAAKAALDKGNHEEAREHIKKMSTPPPPGTCRASATIEETIACVDEALAKLEKEYDHYGCLTLINEPFNSEGSKH